MALEAGIECSIMPSFPLLDVAIGLSFIYLLLSLICSSLNEGLESLLRNRANDLEAGIRMLLSDPNKHSWFLSFWPWTSSIRTGITREFYLHPLIRNLFRDENRLPNYIPARNFSLALMDLMFPDPTPAGSPAPAAMANLPEGLKKSVTLLMNAAQGDAEQARANIEGWFNSTMDRASGWYKHRTQFILFGIGLGVTIGVNADSIQVLSTLAHSKTLAAVVAAAGQATGQPLTQNVDVATQVSNAMGSLQSLDIGIGWERELSPQGKQPKQTVQPERVPPAFFSDTCDSANASCQHPWGWLGYLIGFHWIGWLITAAAISLGAPFWFDTLSRFMVVRSTVKPKDASGDQSS
jgi:hypothetical protein